MITADTLDWPALHAAAFGLLARRAAYQGAEDAEGIAQEALLRLYRALARGATFNAPEALWAYLWRAYTGALIDARRSTQGRLASQSLSFRDFTAAEAADLFDDWPEMLAAPAPEQSDAEALIALAAQLTPAQRVALLATADGYRPRHIQAHWPALFAEVNDVYQALRMAQRRMSATLEAGATTLRPYVVRARRKEQSYAAD